MSSVLKTKMIEQAAILKEVAGGLQEAVEVLEQIKGGAISIVERDRFAEVYDAVVKLENASKVALRMKPEDNFTDEFIISTHGKLLGFGYQWLYHDDLITRAEAAAMLTHRDADEFRKSPMMRSKVQYYLYGSNPKLKLYWVPEGFTEEGRYPTRLRRTEVESLMSQKGLRILRKRKPKVAMMQAAEIVADHPHDFQYQWQDDAVACYTCSICGVSEFRRAFN